MAIRATIIISPKPQTLNGKIPDGNPQSGDDEGCLHFALRDFPRAERAYDESRWEL